MQDIKNFLLTSLWGHICQQYVRPRTLERTLITDAIYLILQEYNFSAIYWFMFEDKILRTSYWLLFEDIFDNNLKGQGHLILWFSSQSRMRTYLSTICKAKNIRESLEFVNWEFRMVNNWDQHFDSHWPVFCNTHTSTSKLIFVNVLSSHLSTHNQYFLESWWTVATNILTHIDNFC